MTTATPTIAGFQVLSAGAGKYKHAVGFQLVYSSPLDPSIAQNTGNYTITQTMKRGREKIAQAIGFGVVYNAAAHTVNLMISGTHRFTNGGRLVVNLSPQTANTGSSGDDAIFSIRPNGRGIVG